MVKPKDPYLIGSYGMFWQTSDVNWTPGLGKSWQLLGKRGTYAGTLRVCDFRAARGFYILFDDHGANYVGLAVGNEGIASRLVKHYKNDNKHWSRFCWFSFDDVVAIRDGTGWSEVIRRDAIKEVSARTTVRELEALLIMVLGARDNKAQMKLHDAGFAATYVLEDLEPNLERCMADAATLLERLGRKIAVEHLSAGSTS